MKKFLSIFLILIILTTFSFAVDSSGANAPELYQGLYPIKYDAGGQPIILNTPDSDWYDYSTGKWANAVTLDKLGQMNPSSATVDNITGYYVWIPRYAYLIRTGYNSSDTGRIDIRFLDGATNKDQDGTTYYTVADLDNESEKWEELNTVTYVGDRQMDYLVHPAFRFEEELTGIWVGKYEASFSERGDIDRDGIVGQDDVDRVAQDLVNSDIPDYDYDVYEDGKFTAKDRSLAAQRQGSANRILHIDEGSKYVNIDQAFDFARDMTSKSEEYDIYNFYGFADDVNTHLIKATEYGAVVYLENSIYGEKSDTEIYRVIDIDEGKEYIAGGLDASIGIINDKYIDRILLDDNSNVIDVKGSAYLETSNGTAAWEGQTTVGNNLEPSAGIIVKENEYGAIGSSGKANDIGFRVVLTKGTNENSIKEAYVEQYIFIGGSKTLSYWWLMENGDVWVMGENCYGQLGVNDMQYISLPQRLIVDSEGNQLPQFEKIYVYGDSVWYIGKDNNVYVSGENEYNQLGTTSTGEGYNDFLGKNVSCVKTITKIDIADKPDGARIIEVFGGTALKNIFLLDDMGNVYVCGQNSMSMLTGGSTRISTVTKIEMADKPDSAKIIGVFPNYDGKNVQYLDDEGNVYACGKNNHGELGSDSSRLRVVTKIEIPDKPVDAKIVKVVNREWNSWYLDNQGNVYTCGDNEYGQLGIEGFDSLSVATMINIVDKPADAKIIDIVASIYGISVWYLDDQGNVYASGDNEGGELGIQGIANVNKVTKIEIPDKPIEAKIIDVILADSDNIVWYIDDMGNIYGCGFQECGELGIGMGEGEIVSEVVKINRNIPNVKFKSIFVNGCSAYYITETGEVYVSGNNENGELGLDHKNDVYTITKSEFLSDINFEKINKGNFITKDKKTYTLEKQEIDKVSNKKIVDIINKRGNTYYLTKDGEVYVSGDNGGALGNGSIDPVNSIEKLDIKEEKFIDINNAVLMEEGEDEEGEYIEYYDYTNAYYLTQNGDIYVNGKNTGGELLTGDSEPVLTLTKLNIPGNPRIIAKEFANDSYAGYYLDDEGNVYNAQTLLKEKVPNNAKIVRMKYHKSGVGCFFWDTEGKLYAKGNNMFYTLGTTGNGAEIKEVVLPDDNIKIVDVFGYHVSSWFIDDQGKVYVSGWDNNHQMGIGGVIYVPTLLSIAGDPKIIKVVSDNNSAMRAWYLDDEGNVYVAGVNSYGELGMGDTTQIDTITKVSIPAKIIDIIVSDNSGMRAWYIDDEGDVYVSGRTANGELGMGNTTEVKTVTRVDIARKPVEAYIVKIILNENGSSAWYLDDMGNVYVSGKNTKGYFGISSTENVKSIRKIDDFPTNIPIVDVKLCYSKDDVLVGAWYIAENGEVYASGVNANGELGISDAETTYPRKISLEDKSYSTLGDIESIYGNATSTVFEEDDGDVYVIGDNTNNKLGITGEIDIATKINIRNIKDVGIGSDFAVFLKDDGSIVGYGNSSKNGNGLTNIEQIAVGKNHAVFLTKTGEIINKGTTTSAFVTGVTNVYKIVAGDNHTVVLFKNGTTKAFGQTDSNLTNVQDIFAGNDMTVYIVKGNIYETYIMSNDVLSKTNPSVKSVVQAELNGEEPYFVTYDRRLIDKDGNPITIFNTELTWVKEVKGDVVLNERKCVYDLSKL